MTNRIAEGETLMKLVRTCLLAAAVGLAGIVSAPAVAQTPSSSTAAPKTTAKIATWTRARLAAAKKRWAEDNAKFTDCSKQLADQQKVKRLSLHRQGHFLQECMTKKP
jgi:hypothetical protein